MDFDLLGVRMRLGNPVVGREIDLHPVISSTQAEALRLADRGVAEGIVVVADTQTAGRGRRGRTWQDLPGCCLLLSVLLRPARPADQQPVLSLAAAAAAATAIRRAAGVEARTKWPNDLLLGNVKVGGVLLQATSDAVAVGIGINVSGPVEELQARVDRPLTTVEQAAGRPVAREDILVELLQSLEQLYAAFRQEGPPPIVDAYRPFEITLGRQVTVEGYGAAGQLVGRATRIDELGRLVVVDDYGREHSLTAAEVTLAAIEE